MRLKILENQRNIVKIGINLKGISMMENILFFLIIISWRFPLIFFSINNFMLTAFYFHESSVDLAIACPDAELN